MNDNDLNTNPDYQNNFNPQYPKQNNQPEDFQQPNYYNSQQNYQQTIPPQQPIPQTPYPQYQNNQNMYQYQNQYMYNPYLRQQRRKKSAFILSIIGFIMGCFSLITALFFIYLMIASSSSMYYDESNILFSLFGVFSVIGMYSQLPGLVCSIIGRILSGKIYQIKQEKSKLFSTLGIIFCAVCIFSTIVLIVWAIHGLASLYNYDRY